MIIEVITFCIVIAGIGYGYKYSINNPEDTEQ